MRVAVLADIHGNLPALEAVLREVAASEVNAVLLNGDMVTGPMPAETLDRLAALGERAIWVGGNCEREVVAAVDGRLDPRLPEVARVPTEYCASRLSQRTSGPDRRAAPVDPPRRDLARPGSVLPRQHPQRHRDRARGQRG